jgi:uncharacterized protein YqgC (DUF456 family)
MDFFIITTTIILFAAGFIGSVVPLLPGPFLILSGAFLYAWHINFTSVSWTTLGVLSGLAVFSQIMDYTASVIGAKKFGASKWGIIGAFAGGLLGVFFGGIAGIIIGPVIGAVFFEIVNSRSINRALKTGLGTFLGFIGSGIGRLIITIIMTGIFLYNVL